MERRGEERRTVDAIQNEPFRLRFTKLLQATFMIFKMYLLNSSLFSFSSPPLSPLLYHLSPFAI
jgi:hypothetical protein